MAMMQSFFFWHIYPCLNYTKTLQTLFYGTQNTIHPNFIKH